MLWLENFINMQTDWNWGWGPLISFRPPPHQHMGLACYLIYGLAIPFALVLSIILIVSYWLFQAPSYQPTSFWLFLRLSVWTVHEYAPAFAVGALYGLVAGGATILCWNRRADRLSRRGF